MLTKSLCAAKRRWPKLSSSSPHAQAATGDDAELDKPRAFNVSPAGVDLVGRLLAPRQADRISIKHARKHGWITGRPATGGLREPDG